MINVYTLNVRKYLRGTKPDFKCMTFFEALQDLWQEFYDLESVSKVFYHYFKLQDIYKDTTAIEK